MPPDALISAQNAPNAFVGRTLPRPAAWVCSPRPPSWIQGVRLLRERRGMRQIMAGMEAPASGGNIDATFQMEDTAVAEVRGVTQLVTHFEC